MGRSVEFAAASRLAGGNSEKATRWRWGSLSSLSSLPSLPADEIVSPFVLSDLTDFEDERAGLPTAEQPFILEILLSLNLFLKLQKSSHQDQEGIPLKTQTAARSVGNGGL